MRPGPLPPPYPPMFVSPSAPDTPWPLQEYYTLKTIILLHYGPQPSGWVLPQHHYGKGHSHNMAQPRAPKGRLQPEGCIPTHLPTHPTPGSRSTGHSARACPRDGILLSDAVPFPLLLLFQCLIQKRMLCRLCVVVGRGKVVLVVVPLIERRVDGLNANVGFFFLANSQPLGGGRSDFLGGVGLGALLVFQA